MQPAARMQGAAQCNNSSRQGMEVERCSDLPAALGTCALVPSVLRSRHNAVMPWPQLGKALTAAWCCMHERVPSGAPQPSREASSAGGARPGWQRQQLAHASCGACPLPLLCAARIAGGGGCIARMSRRQRWRRLLARAVVAVRRVAWVTVPCVCACVCMCVCDCRAAAGTVVWCV